MTWLRDFLEALKALGSIGVGGLIIWLLYKLVDRWAPQFLAAHQQQAKAMTDLAGAVREGREEQRDLVMAVRALAAKIDQQTEHIDELETRVRERVKGAAV